MENLEVQLQEACINFLQQHLVHNREQNTELTPYTGNFSLLRGKDEADLYGMIDAVYILFILGLLHSHTTQDSRKIWANRILACQDEMGWFSLKNLRGHSREHATAYAIGALTLLEVESEEQYVAQIKPLDFAKPILTDQRTFLRWIDRLGFEYKLNEILRKNIGWNHIWRSSHIGGGIPAALQMTRDLHKEWWGDQIDVDIWFQWYFHWLNEHVNPQTGFWQRAMWNTFYRKATLIDMGGAVHFFWIYDAQQEPFCYPEQVIESTIKLQKATGLYKNHPFCIDLDGNFCIIRSFLQLPTNRQTEYKSSVYSAIEANFEGIITTLTKKSFNEIYANLHGLPGALAALAECTKLPNFRYSTHLAGWQNPFDKVCWL